MARKRKHISDGEAHEKVEKLVLRGRRYLQKEEYERALSCFQQALQYAPFRKDIKELVAYTLDSFNDVSQPAPPRLTPSDRSPVRPLETDNASDFPERDLTPLDLDEETEKEIELDDEFGDEFDEEDNDDLFEDEGFDDSRFGRGRRKKPVSKFWVFFLVLSLVLFVSVLSMILVGLQKGGYLKSSKLTQEQKAINLKVNKLIEEATLLSGIFQKRYSEAITKLEQAHDLEPPEETVEAIEDKLAEVYYDKGNDEYYAGKYQDSKESFENAANRRPDVKEYSYSLGWAFYKLGMQDKNKKQRLSQRYFSFAEESFKQAIELDPNYAKAYNGLGNTYIRTNNLEEAIQNLKTAIELDPDSDTATRARDTLRQYGAKE